MLADGNGRDLRDRARCLAIYVELAIYKDDDLDSDQEGEYGDGVSVPGYHGLREWESLELVFVVIIKKFGRTVGSIYPERIRFETIKGH
jgi:hypothetical protein